MTGTEDWHSLEETLAAACDEPDEKTAERAVRAAELVASTAGEPPDDLTPEDREWAETHGIPPAELVDLACRSMKCVAALSEDWHHRLNDLRYRPRRRRGGVGQSVSSKKRTPGIGLSL